MSDLSESIESAAAAPLKSSADSISAEQHPLQDLIAADRYLASKEAAANNGPLGGIVLSRLRPPGTVARDC